MLVVSSILSRRGRPAADTDTTVYVNISPLVTAAVIAYISIVKETYQPSQLLHQQEDACDSADAHLSSESKPTHKVRYSFACILVHQHQSLRDGDRIKPYSV